MIELSTSEAAVWTIVSTAVGALIAAWATLYAARFTAHRQRLYEESAKFRAAFINEIIGLRLADEDAFKVLSDEVLARHEQAKVLFEPWVGKAELSTFHAAWREYAESVKTVAPGSLNNRRNECLVQLERLENLIAFARHEG